MILVEQASEIMHITDDALRLIETAGRVCYKSEDKTTDISHKNFAHMLLNRGHEAVIEHATMTVRFVCDRGISHELVRHRIASFCQESTRYCNYSGEVKFIIPTWANIEQGKYVAETEGKILPSPGKDLAVICWMKAMLSAEKDYQCLLDLGWKPEQARSVLPNSLKTEVIMTANFREWRHFFRLRTAAAAHPQMRALAKDLLQKVRHWIPTIFDDLQEKG